MDLSDFLYDLQKQLAEQYKTITSNYFKASISGSKVDFERSAEAQLEYDRLLADKDTYHTLMNCIDSEKLDTINRRAAEILLNESRGRQVDDEILESLIRQQNKIEQAYTIFRAEIDGKEISDNQLEEILSSSDNSDTVKVHWEASKEIGNNIASELIELVKLRNASAHKLGYENYHSMQLMLNEIDPLWLEKTFDDLDNLTRPTFKKMKEEVDNHLATRFNIDKNNLMPWHYGNRFFQEAPPIYLNKLDKTYHNAPIHQITKHFYDSIGLNIDSVSANSDLYEKDGKNQHAFCIDIDRTIGDIRVLCNIVPSHRWMDTDLHEFGHAAYDLYLDRSLPWILMTPAHIFTTEAIAMLFGRLAGDAEWVGRNVINDLTFNDNGAGKKAAALAQITFSRWAQVMYRFEKAMYSNPEQNLQDLWWKLVNHYQLLNIPDDRDSDNDWASKIHIATVPCYYHNYLLGELLASQLQAFITKNVTMSDSFGAWAGDKKIGAWLKSNIFQPGKLYVWNQMIEKAMGENLSPYYYTAEFCNEEI